MTPFGRPFRLTSPYNIEPDAEAILSPYDAFEPDQPDEPEHSPYMAQNKAAIEASLGAGTGRRGFSAYESEDAQDTGPDDPGFLPASQVPGGYGGSYSAGGTQTPNPAGMAGGKSPASTPTRPNPYDDPPLGGDDSPALDEEDVPQNETDSPYEKHVSPEWAAVARIDEEIAATKRERGSLGGILGGVFRNRAAGAQDEAEVRSLLAERGQLVAQAQWADNRRSTEVQKTYDAVGPDGQKHKWALTRGGQKIDLGLTGESDREKQAKIEAKWRMQKAMLENEGKYLTDSETGEAYVMNPYTGEREPLTRPKMVEQQGPVRPEDPGLPDLATKVPFKPQPKKSEQAADKFVHSYEDKNGNVVEVWQNTATNTTYEKKRSGVGKGTSATTSGDPSDKILASAKSAEERARASHRANPMNFGQEPFSDEENAIAKKAYDYAYAQAVDHYQRAGKPTPRPAPETQGPPADLAAPRTPNFTEEDLKAGKKPDENSIALLTDKDGKRRLARYDKVKGKFVWIQ
jgi:hypothetical protein